MSDPDLGLLTESWVLPDDVVIIPVEALAPHHRDQLNADIDGFALSRQFARSPSKLLKPAARDFLELFRSPVRINDAVLAYGTLRGIDPRQVLRDTYPLIRSCIDTRFLVPEDSPLSSRIVPIFNPGDTIGALSIVRCAALLDDTELYQATDGTALSAIKILRPEPDPVRRDRLLRERDVLRHLGGDIAPRLLADGVFEGREYLQLEWCPGVALSIIIQEEATGPHRPERRWQTGLAILDLYRRLHGRGVLHGDPHPQNILIDQRGCVRLVDFEYARLFEGGVPDMPAGGPMRCIEPELAEVLETLRGTSPPISARGEQYRIGTLLYRLLTGGEYLDMALDRARGLRQIIEDAPLPFSRRGVAPWPAAEAVLGRAMNKRPEDRFPSLDEFCQAWSAIGEPPPPHPGAIRTADAAMVNDFRTEMRDRLSLSGGLMSETLAGPVRASVANGAAGIAFCLYRQACIREDPMLLAAADGWITQAAREAGDESVFYADELNMGKPSLGNCSAYHTGGGVYAVRALVSLAMGNIAEARHAVDRFIDAHPAAPSHWDVMLGNAGNLIAAANLLSAIRGRSDTAETRLTAYGDAMLTELLEPLAEGTPIRGHAAIPNLGIAHGWGGLLYAVLRWLTVQARDLPNCIEARLVELAGCAEAFGRGARWRWMDEAGAAPKYIPGWCNGSAGFVFLWTLADKWLARPPFVELAEAAAWNTWESPAGPPHLCCGEAGRAYALLNLYRHLGDPSWLDRAHTLAHRAVRLRHDVSGGDAAVRERSLYRGDVGVALLLTDLEHPEQASMPFFEDEGWPAPAGRNA